jgi:hypothetical protein
MRIEQDRRISSANELFFAVSRCIELSIAMIALDRHIIKYKNIQFLLLQYMHYILHYTALPSLRSALARPRVPDRPQSLADSDTAMEDAAANAWNMIRVALSEL